AGHLFGKEQEFRLNRPDAQSVALMCECKDWQAQPMSKGADGVWTTSVSVSPGTYGYKFLVNGNEWIFDPNTSNRKSVKGMENSAVRVSEATAGSSATTPSQSTATTSTPPVSTASSNTGTLAPVPGEILTLEIPLSEKRRAEAAKDGDSRLTHAKMA